jgi:hypothetical protein
MIGAALLTIAPLAAGANLLANGSFETPTVPVGSFTDFAPGSGALTDWTVFTGGVSIVNGSFGQNGVSFPAQDGVQWLDLTGNGSNSTEGVSQTVATTAGHQYRLSFYVGNTTGGGIFGSTSTVAVLLNGSVALTATNTATSPTTQNWFQFTHTFTASGATTTLGFRNGDPATDNNNGLDNVVLIDVGVAAIPEPETYAMLLAGLGLLVFMARRRKQ